METTKWIFDPAHTSVEFEVRHLMISTVTGTFDEKRDAHLKSADFFEADKYPKISFVSTSFKKTGDKQFELAGDLTIRGTTKNVNLAVTHGGTVKDNFEKTKVGFEIIGKIKRSDFGLVWNATIEAGGVLVSDEVKIIVNVEFKKLSES